MMKMGSAQNLRKIWTRSFVLKGQSLRCVPATINCRAFRSCSNPGSSLLLLRPLIEIVLWLRCLGRLCCLWCTVFAAQNFWERNPWGWIRFLIAFTIRIESNRYNQSYYLFDRWRYPSNGVEAKNARIAIRTAEVLYVSALRLR